MPPTSISTEVERFLEEATFGSLGLAQDDDGYPVVVPVNFVLLRGSVYFHGSSEGEKMRALARDNRVSFSVVEAFSLIPSHFSGPSDACGASQYFKSVVIRGRACVVASPSEKAESLDALMRKLQPEGGYRPITTEDARYVESVEATAVVRIEVERLTAKFKLGQSLPESRRERIVERLTERGRPLDLRTIEEMRRQGKGH